MSEPVRDALLIAYLAGGVLMLVALARVLLTWTTSSRTSRHASPPDSDDDDALRQVAVTAVAAVAARAGVAAPCVDVVALLGAPHGEREPVTGDGGLAVTRFRVGRPPIVVFARAALTGLSPAAVRSLAAHELAHVIRRERGSAAARYAWLGGYVVLMLAGVALSTTAAVASPELGGLALLATLASAVAFLSLQVAFDRREEIAADLFAIDLTHDLDAAAELMRFLDEHVTRPVPRGRLGRAWARLDRTWFATHPAVSVRLAAMRTHLVDRHQPG